MGYKKVEYSSCVFFSSNGSIWWVCNLSCRKDSGSEEEAFDANAAFFTKVVNKKKKAGVIPDPQPTTKAKLKKDTKTNNNEEEVSWKIEWLSWHSGMATQRYACCDIEAWQYKDRSVMTLRHGDSKICVSWHWIVVSAKPLLKAMLNYCQ